MSACKAVSPNSFGMFLICDAVDKPLRPMANRLGGVFLFGLRPRFLCFGCFWLFASLFPLAKRKSGWGICGSSSLVGCCGFFVCLFQSICRLSGLLLSLYKGIFCLFSYKDRAFSATSAKLEEKNEHPWIHSERPHSA